MTAAPRPLYGPRRIAAVGEMAARAETPGKEERGPRLGAPDAALDGFLRKHGATREQLTQEGQFWVLQKPGAGDGGGGAGRRAAARPAARLPLAEIHALGQQRLRLGPPAAAHPLRARRPAGALRAGAWRGCGAWPGRRRADRGPSRAGRHRALRGAVLRRLRARAARPLRRRRCGRAGADHRDGHRRAGRAPRGWRWCPTAACWPRSPGWSNGRCRCSAASTTPIMDLPPEVMRTSMRVNQRYFALRHRDGRAGAALRRGVQHRAAATAAPRSSPATSACCGRGCRMPGSSGTRTASSRWKSALPKLEGVVFHAKLGTQGERVARLETAGRADRRRMVGADPDAGGARPRGWPRPIWPPAWSANSPSCRA